MLVLYEFFSGDGRIMNIYNSDSDITLTETGKIRNLKSICFIILIMLLGWAVVFYFSLYFFKINALQIRKQALSINVERIGDFFDNEYLAHAVRLSEMEEMKAYFSGGLSEREIYPILETARVMDNAVFVSLIGLDGKITTLSSYEKKEKVMGLDISDRMYVIKGLRGESSIFLNIGRVSKKRTAQFSAPVLSADGKNVLGIVMTNIEVGVLDRFLSFIPEPTYLLSPGNIVFASNREDDVKRKVANYADLFMDNKADIADNTDLLCLGGEVIEQKVVRFPGWVVVSFPEFDFPYVLVCITSLIYFIFVVLIWIVILLRKRKRESLNACIAVNEAYRREMEILERESAAKELVEKLEKSEARLRLAQESAGVGIWSYELETEKLEWSDFIASVFEIDEKDLKRVLEKYLKSVYVDEIGDVQQKIVVIIRDGESEEYECQVDSQDKQRKYWVAIKGKCVYSKNNKPVRIIGTIISINDRKRAEFEKADLEDRMRHSQRLDAIGQLAGGIAHDFNNMLCGIIGSADILKRRLNGDSKALEINSMIISTAERAADLTKQLLAFSRKQTVTLKAIDGHEIIGNSIRLLRRTVDLKVTIQEELVAENSFITGDAAQLQSVFLNLGINAVHAMNNSGELKISTSNIYLDKSYCNASSFSLVPGEYLEIEVTDNGSGIEPEIMAKIFEPFFTTKEAGKGTGLGLSVVYGIVQQHNGAVNVYSEVGKGTCFHILLPLEFDEHQAKRSDSDKLYMGDGTILVIDDEEVMRKNALFVLEDLGYEVLLAADGDEGINIFVQNLQKIDLVIIDMVMPVMSGMECFFEIKKINQDIKIILASGFSRDEDVEKMKSEGLCEFIHKPYRSSHLSYVVHKVLKKDE